MTGRRALAFLLVLGALSARAADVHVGEKEIMPRRDFPKQVQEAPQKEETPTVLRWMIKPLRRGMFIRLPIMDTDPNRGFTFGVMPIVVLQGEKDDRIKAIHAPSLTYNKNFFLTPTYRYYFYPQEDASATARASWSKYEREFMGQYEDKSVGGTRHDLFLRVQQNLDAGQRFYGFGPDSPKSAESNYAEDYWQYKWGLGTPIGDSPWRTRLFQHYQSGRITNGPLANLPTFRNSFPEQYTERRQQLSEQRLMLEYDTRDHGVTTTRGTFFEAYVGASKRGFLSAYDYGRQGLDFRWFRPLVGRPDDVFALQARYEQLTGPRPPFWAHPMMGGKYSLRAYGNGRFVDRGVASLNVEQRLKLFDFKSAGVTTDFQVAPFAGVGSVFDKPENARRKYMRPVVGAALRAVAKPQVVGSVDFGVGQEGLSVFMDINYSF